MGRSKRKLGLKLLEKLKRPYFFIFRPKIGNFENLFIDLRPKIHWRGKIGYWDTLVLRYASPSHDGLIQVLTATLAEKKPESFKYFWMDLSTLQSLTEICPYSVSDLAFLCPGNSFLVHLKLFFCPWRKCQGWSMHICQSTVSKCKVEKSYAQNFRDSHKYFIGD